MDVIDIAVECEGRATSGARGNRRLRGALRAGNNRRAQAYLATTRGPPAGSRQPFQPLGRASARDSR